MSHQTAVTWKWHFLAHIKKLYITFIKLIFILTRTSYKTSINVTSLENDPSIPKIKQAFNDWEQRWKRSNRKLCSLVSTAPEHLDFSQIITETYTRQAAYSTANTNEWPSRHSELRFSVTSKPTSCRLSWFQRRIELNINNWLPP